MPPTPGKRRMTQPRAKLDDPKQSAKTFKRLMGLILKRYKVHMIFVFLCIIISVLASVQGTLFIQTLFDDYISPMVEQVAALLRERGIEVRTGRFRTHMVVRLVNDGPVTILLDSEKTF